MLRGGLVADAIATTSSVDPVMGEVGPVRRRPGTESAT